MNGLQFSFGIQRPEFGWLRQVNHPWHNHVIVVGIVMIVSCIGHNLISSNLAFFGRNRQYLVAIKFNGTSLMHADMSRISGNHALIRSQQCIDHHGIGLRAADQELDLPHKLCESVL